MGCSTSSQKEQHLKEMCKRPSEASIKAAEGLRAGPTLLTSNTRSLSVRDMAENVRIINSSLKADTKECLDPATSIQIRSQTDINLKPFANKCVIIDGRLSTTDLGFGYACHKGRKPGPNQDSFCFIRVDDEFSLYGVFDGHGRLGHLASDFAARILPALITQHPLFSAGEMATVVHNAFIRMQHLMKLATTLNRMDLNAAGTTATVVVHSHQERTLTVANVGDSACCLRTSALTSAAGVHQGNVMMLTVNHKPEIAKERHRIEAAGGRVIFDGFSNWRVVTESWGGPGLNMSRALGDVRGHATAGLSAEPDIREHKLEPGGNDVLIMCSDGVWDYMKPEEVAQIILEHGDTKSMEAADHLASEAWNRWVDEFGGETVDDITALVAWLGAV